MLKWPIPHVLTVTATAPLLVSSAVVTFLNDDWIITCCLLVAAALSIGFCWWFLHAIRSSRAPGAEPYTITSVEPANNESVAIMLLYFLPLYTADFDKLNWIIGPLAILSFAVFVRRSHSYFFNPVLSFFGWHFYRVGTPQNVTHLLITKKTIRKIDRKISAIQLSDYVIFEVD